MVKSPLQVPTVRGSCKPETKKNYFNQMRFISSPEATFLYTVVALEINVDPYPPGEFN
jgi:hypothetical protein